MAKNRAGIFVKGLGNFEIMQVLPTPASGWTKVGYVESTQLVDEPTMQELVDETGSLIDLMQIGQKFGFTTNLMQSSKAEIDYMRNVRNMVHAVRYYGPLDNGAFQYWCGERCVIVPKVALNFGAAKRSLPLGAMAIKQADLSYDVPLAFFIETNAIMKLDKLSLWVDSRLGLNTETDRLLDISGFARHGQLSSAYATIWDQTTYPAEFLRFDGANDSVNFGNILNDDGTADFMVECWVRVMGADGGQEEILGKKSLYSNTTAGFALVRTSANKIGFRLADGTTGVAATSSTSVLQNVWKHVAVTVDRNGNAQIYINGAADGSAADVSALATGTNALNLYLGRDNTTLGQVDIGMFRVHTYGAGNLPSDIATIVANHFSAERSFYNI